MLPTLTEPVTATLPDVTTTLPPIGIYDTVKIPLLPTSVICVCTGFSGVLDTSTVVPILTLPVMVILSEPNVTGSGFVLVTGWPLSVASILISKSVFELFKNSDVLALYCAII